MLLKYVRLSIQPSHTIQVVFDKNNEMHLTNHKSGYVNAKKGLIG